MISTKIDKMIELIEKSPKSFSQLSASLREKQHLVERWASILEEQNVVEISYHPLKHPTVKLKKKPV